LADEAEVLEKEEEKVAAALGKLGVFKNEVLQYFLFSLHLTMLISLSF
jgi:hypothetical protein